MELILYVDEGEESRRVEELLQRSGLRYRRVQVDGRLLGWLLLEYGRWPPVLIVGEKVLHGREIEREFGGVRSEEDLKLYRRRGCW